MGLHHNLFLNFFHFFSAHTFLFLRLLPCRRDNCFLIYIYSTTYWPRSTLILAKIYTFSHLHKKVYFLHAKSVLFDENPANCTRRAAKSRRRGEGQGQVCSSANNIIKAKCIRQPDQIFPGTTFRRIPLWRYSEKFFQPDMSG